MKSEKKHGRKKAEKIEKIKREVLEELAKMEREELEKAGREINLENFFEEVIEKIYERAVELAVRKTAEEIFGEIEKGIDKMQKLVEKTLEGDDNELSYACGEGEVMGLDLAKDVVKELKRNWWVAKNNRY